MLHLKLRPHLLMTGITRTVTKLAIATIIAKRLTVPRNKIFEP
jgi:hypothetical protein